MHNSAIAASCAAGVWIVDRLAAFGQVPFWLALLLAAVLAWKAGRAMHRVMRGEP